MKASLPAGEPILSARLQPDQVLDAAILAQAATGDACWKGMPVRIPLLPREPAGCGPAADGDFADGATKRRVCKSADVEADNSPDISWEVHVGRAGFAPNPRTLVGIVSLFGAGLRDRAQHFHPAEFVFPINAAIRGLDPATLEVALVPSPDGSATPGAQAVRPRSPVRIGDIAIIVDAPMPQPPREEQERLRREERAD